MNTVLFAHNPATISQSDRELVEFENAIQTENGNSPYSLESDQDIAEAAREIRYRNAEFVNRNILDNRGLFFDQSTGNLLGREIGQAQPNNNK